MKEGKEPEFRLNLELASSMCPSPETSSGWPAPRYPLTRKRLETFVYGRRTPHLLTSPKAR